MVNIWFSLNQKDKDIVISLLDGPLRRIDIARSLDTDSGSLSYNLKNLENLSFIGKENNLYLVSEPLLVKWLKAEYEQKGEYPYVPM